jgi:predicted secreted hydrolase
MRRLTRFRTAVAWCVVGVAAALSACSGEDRLPRARLSLEETLGGADTLGYARAVEPREFVFPGDHGPHPDFRNEWWYVTGNVQADDGREVGFQFTIFRSALAPEPAGGDAAPQGDAATGDGSAWATRQAYMGHFAVTDVAGRRFHAAERFARGAMGLAGARADPFRVWIEGWSLEGVGDDGAAGAGRSGGESATAVFPLRLRASDGEMAVDLVLDAGRPHVLQGDRGLSQKGSEAGNASYYYSHTRMPTRGTVILGADTLRVAGLSWLDREWSTSALSDGQVGWDWFALQLDNGWDLMVYQLRTADGAAHPLSDGVLVDPSGAKHDLAWGSDVSVTPTGTWTSPLDGSIYPSGWRIALPAEGWALEVTPVLPGQELDLAFRYWEGAVRVAGTAEGAPVSGRGYVELTGYAGVRPER